MKRSFGIDSGAVVVPRPIQKWVHARIDEIASLPGYVALDQFQFQLQFDLEEIGIAISGTLGGFAILAHLFRDRVKPRIYGRRIEETEAGIATITRKPGDQN